MIAIVDYGIGNLGSIHNLIWHIGGSAEITKDRGVLRDANGIVIPGVGSFDACMLAFRRSGLLDLIESRIAAQTPLLGICVGMQMMTRGSEEGREEGLGWLAADVRKFSASPGLRVPHMGWSPVSVRARDNPLFADPDPEQRFYFVHSYHVVCDNPEDVAAVGHYGGPFAAAITRGNMYGVQFHPEKSHRFGMQLFANFLKIAGEPSRHAEAVPARK